MRPVLELRDQVDLVALLGAIDDYVLLKRSEEFPRYYRGTDVDLAVFDRGEAVRRVCDFYESSVRAEGTELRVTDEDAHCHVDFIVDGQLEIRVDFIDSFEFLRNIAVKPSFMFKLFMDRESVHCGSGVIHVPCEEDELTLRYFEYLEWFAQRPDKVKHLDYICAVEDERIKQRFFANTHRFTQLKRKTWPVRSWRPRTRSEAWEQVRLGCRFLVGTAIRGLLRRLKISRRGA